MDDMLKVLADIRIASPCAADWGSMAGDDRARHCGECGKSVYNLSAMTAAEGVALIRGHEGKICVQIARRADGTVLTEDCPVGAARGRLRSLLAVAAGGLAAMLGLPGCRDQSPPTRTLGAPLPALPPTLKGKLVAPTITRGEVAATPTPPGPGG